MRCSSLNQHLFSKNINQSPLCIWGEVEDSKHFFLECSLYNNIRHDMLTAVSRFCNPGLDVLLYGNPTLSNETNISIFTAIHTFILGTKCFCYCPVIHLQYNYYSFFVKIHRVIALFFFFFFCLSFFLWFF